MLLALVDKRIPNKAKKNLSLSFRVIEFETSSLTYKIISGHPDIFFCKHKDTLIAAPNVPSKYLSLFAQNNISYILGSHPIGKKYPDTAPYNVVITKKFLIHNLRKTDKIILERSVSLKKINTSQGYTRCNILPLKNNYFITSDLGIYKQLSTEKCSPLYINPEGISLPDAPYGFFGGTCGIYKNSVYFLGSLSYFPEGRKIERFLKKLNYKIIELYKGPLFDGGSILFL